MRIQELPGMGNCVLKVAGERVDVVKVVTVDGGIMELYAPITAECITGEYPGHAIFTSRSIFSEPLLHKDELHAGQVYYLLPLNPYKPSAKIEADAPSVVSTPYRMSTCESQNAVAKKRAAEGEAEVFPKYSSTGVWKVKLVICPEQLSEILKQGNRTEELIENVRTVAKCGNGVGSAASSDHSSVAGSWKGSAMDKPQYGLK
ncbi:uncharacterized protein LOC111800623 [Cucurbita pepo subsp. pepo]|uniref:uncharacterized protein LOC111800623 n=1 Tax=Cucurbita pepo subsp. pepo TaxID=3664 RepID=UPI000C9D6F24|nr:uncharacterized protein LOC111800623 [Cucurbita pepo subsp. pepo]